MDKKRVVVWGTGVVGSMVIAEIADHPVFELVGVGVSNPAKVGVDAGTICGIAPTGVIATDSVEELVALKPDALVHYGPTAQFADENIRVMSAFLRAGIDVCSTAMTPWVWPTMTQNPAAWIDPITEACAAGGASCFTTGVDPGFANDLFPMTLMGLCGRVDSVRASELVDYTDYEGDYEDEMGIGRSPDFTPLLEIPDLLIMAWGATVPMMAAAVGIELDDITTTWEKWVTPEDRTTVKGVVEAGHVASINLRILNHGGPSRTAQAIAVCRAANVDFRFGAVFGSSIVHAHTLHLAASLPRPRFPHEFSEMALLDNDLYSGLHLQAGTVAVPAGVGTGLVFNG
jgi:4-hydroxy-tetrahydrodipicolinate reductase